MPIIRTKIWEKEIEKQKYCKPDENIEFSGEGAFLKLYLYLGKKYGFEDNGFEKTENEEKTEV